MGRDRQFLRRMAREDRYLLSKKVQDRLYMGQLTDEQLRQVLIQGTETKRESDEKTHGEYDKITLVWRTWYVVVKDSDPCFLITAGRRDPT